MTDELGSKEAITGFDKNIVMARLHYRKEKVEIQTVKENFMGFSSRLTNSKGNRKRGNWKVIKGRLVLV